MESIPLAPSAATRPSPGARRTSRRTLLSSALSFVAFLTMTSLLALPASAAKIQNHEDVPIEGNYSLEQIAGKIKNAGKTRGWRMKKVAPGHLVAVIHVRTHTASVDIKFDTKQFSITYKDSDNLGYKEGGRIHRNYNNWIKNLKNDIELELNF